MIEAYFLGPAGGIGFGIWIFWMIATGRLITRREADALMATIEAQRRTIHTQAEQMNLVMKETAPTLNEFLADLRDAVELSSKDKGSP